MIVTLRRFCRRISGRAHLCRRADNGMLPGAMSQGLEQDLPHQHRIRVYYEDTDLAGIVYYANYFRFIERGRTEFLRAAGIDQISLKRESGLVFVVRRVVADFLRPAVMDDEIIVETSVRKTTAARVIMDQHVLRGETVLFSAAVDLAVLKDGRATRLPSSFMDIFAPENGPA